MYATFSLQKMQNFLFCFFCQPLSSFSLRFLVTFGISDRRLLLRPSRADGNALVPVGLSGPSSSLLLDLGRGPLQAWADLLGFDLDLRPLLALRGLPRVGPEAANHDHP